MRGHAGAIFTLLWSSACSAPGPCSVDPLDCRPAGTLEIDDSCELDDELKVAIGEGSEEFEALEQGQGPHVRYGFQGSTHVFLSVRIENPDLAHSSFLLELSVRYRFAPEEAVHEKSRDALIENAEFEPGTPFVQAGLVLVIDPFADGELRLKVTDSCGRVASDVHEFWVGTPPE